MLREEKMREPVLELQALAKVTRNRAMRERTPYEICFTATGFQGRKQVLYTDEEKKQTPSVDQGNTQTSGSAQADGDQPQDDIVAQYALSPDMTCQLLYWGNRQWVDPAADNDPGQCRWVFQASGLCNPLRVQFHKGTAWIEVAFNPLTADVQDERYLFPD